MRSLNLLGVGKQFPGVVALHDVHLNFQAGQVRALLGENGAGKSTLLKLLGGVYRPDVGEIRLDDSRVDFRTPREAMQAGIAIIHQELQNAPHLSVAENLFLGNLKQHGSIINSKRQMREARQLLDRVGLAVHPATLVGDLPIAAQQMVEIARAIGLDAQIFAFDEPTSSLSERESATLFQVIHELKQQGKIVLYVTHRLAEVFRICDAASVLRDGKLVKTFSQLGGIQEHELVTQMVGRELKDVYGYRPRAAGEVVLQHREIDVRKGEVVGLFGLVGAGRTERFREIFHNPKASFREGLALCTEDRKHEGIFASLAVRENINIAARRGLAINSKWERTNATKQIETFKIRLANDAQPIRALSGGNQQKAILGRLFSLELKCLLLDEPTRGIDVGAKKEIYSLIFDLAESGTGILFASSDLSEVMGIADRVLVMREGEISQEFQRGAFSEEAILSAALPR